MALTNAERQKPIRQRRNELARQARMSSPVAETAVTVSADAEDDDHTFADLIEAHWRVGALGLLSHGDDASACPLRTVIAAEVQDHRFSLIDMLEVVEEAGAAWALKRYEQAALDSVAKRTAAPAAPIPAPLAKPRRRKSVT